MIATIDTTSNGSKIVVPATPATYRKTSNDVWVVLAHHDDLLEAAELGAIRVTKKDGSTTVEPIAKVGKPFERDGETFAYGYINDGWYVPEIDGDIRNYKKASR